MTTPDTDEIEKLDVVDTEHDAAGDDHDQSHDETSNARSDEAGDIPGEDDDGNAKPGDPLLLAQQPADKSAPETKAKQPAKADAATDTGKTDPKGAKAPAKKPDAKADDNQATDEEDHDADLKAALADMPSEDWSKLSHKAKSTVLAQRRVARTATAAVKAADERATKASADYEQVEKFRKDHQLDPDEFLRSVSLGSAIKMGRKDVIPFLEQTLEKLKAHHGVAPTQIEQATPAIDLDRLADLASRAENYDLDAIAELKKLAADAKGKAPKPATQAPPARPVVEQRQEQQPQGGANTAENAEFLSVYEALVGAGVPEDRVAERLTVLLKDISKGNAANLPRPGERVRKVLEAHRRLSQAPPPKTPAKTTTAPLSGRGGPVNRGGGFDPNKPIDPMAHALPSRR